MIIRSSSIKELVIDIYTHSFFALLMLSVFFLLGQVKRFRENLDETTEEVLTEINLPNYVSKTDKTNDDINLDNLQKIYDDSSFFDKEIVENLRLSLYTQIGILFISTIIIYFISGKGSKFWKKILFEKVIFFLILVSLEYILYETVIREYEDIKHKDVFNILKRNIDDLN